MWTDTYRERWFSKYPDTQTDETDNLTQHSDTNPPPTIVANSQTGNHYKHNTYATQQPQQGRTDDSDHSNDSKLPQGWFQINRLLAKRRNRGVIFMRWNGQT
jgi:hypothetical protein